MIMQYHISQDEIRQRNAHNSYYTNTSLQASILVEEGEVGQALDGIPGEPDNKNMHAVADGMTALPDLSAVAALTALAALRDLAHASSAVDCFYRCSCFCD